MGQIHFRLRTPLGNSWRFPRHPSRIMGKGYQTPRRLWRLVPSPLHATCHFNHGRPTVQRQTGLEFRSVTSLIKHAPV